MSVIAAQQLPEDQAPTTLSNSVALNLAAAELDDLLNENNFISEAVLSELKAHLASDQLDCFTQLRKLINAYQYDEARKILRQFAKLHDSQ